MDAELTNRFGSNYLPTVYSPASPIQSTRAAVHPHMDFD